MEEWKNTNNTSYRHDTIVAVSNYGRLKLRNCEIKDSYYRQTMRYEGKHTRVHIVIAKLFIPKTEEDIRLNRNFIDHITHNPIGININDIRNLRWCTCKENNNFPEALQNKRDGSLAKTPEWCAKLSAGMKGRVPWNKGKKGLQTPWNKGMSGTDYTSHYPNGVKNSNRAKGG